MDNNTGMAGNSVVRTQNRERFEVILIVIRNVGDIALITLKFLEKFIW